MTLILRGFIAGGTASIFYQLAVLAGLSGAEQGLYLVGFGLIAWFLTKPLENN